MTTQTIETFGRNHDCSDSTDEVISISTERFRRHGQDGTWTNQSLLTVQTTQMAQTIPTAQRTSLQATPTGQTAQNRPDSSDSSDSSDRPDRPDSSDTRTLRQHSDSVLVCLRLVSTREVHNTSQRLSSPACEPLTSTSDTVSWGPYGARGMVSCFSFV